MIRFSSIRVRLALWYVLLLAVILVVFSGILYFLLDHGLDYQIDNDLSSAAEQVLGITKWQDGHLVVQRDERESELTPLGERGMLVRVIGLDGTVIESVGPFSTLPVSREALNLSRSGQSDYDKANNPRDGTPVRIYTVAYQANGKVYGFVQVGQSLKSAQDTLHRLLLVMLFIIPITLLFASVGGLFLANRALSPIDRITRTAQRISAEALTQRLDLALPDDEVGRLARTFDAMLDRLDEAFERQRRFTADASHELRTPLAIMKGDIEVTLHRPRTVGEYQEVLADVQEEVDRLTRMVEDLLLLARSDTSQSLLRLEPFDLANLLHRVTDQVQPIADAKKLTLLLDTPVSVPLRGDPDKLVRLFLNLLDNAIKYSPCRGQITVQARYQEDQGQHRVVVKVRDNGPGIPSEQQAHIFERYYRADVSRTRANGGAGLGLAIARWIAEAHGGHISVQSTPGEGSVFCLTLPAPVHVPTRDNNKEGSSLVGSR